MNERNDWKFISLLENISNYVRDEIYLNSEQGKVEFSRTYLFFSKLLIWFFDDFLKLVTAAAISNW